jgi:hypothetical protein
LLVVADSCVVQEEFGICPNPSFPSKTKVSACDDKMNMRMPFHVGTEGMNNDQNAHTHALDLSRPLLSGLSGGVN